MILQVKNIAEYDQPITLHTGEAKTVLAGSSIKINTGSDRRLASFYASLMNYDFEVSILEASGQEENSFNDAVNRLNVVKSVAVKSRDFQENGTYPKEVITPSTPVLEGDSSDPKTLDGISIPATPVKRQPVSSGKSEVPKVTIALGPVELVDAKTGDPVEDLTPVLPPDYPTVPDPVLDKIEAEEKAAAAAKESSDNKWYYLDKLDEETLKKLLADQFEEVTKLRNKSKIIYHIMDLAEDAGIDVYKLVDEYISEN